MKIDFKKNQKPKTKTQTKAKNHHRSTSHFPKEQKNLEKEGSEASS